MNGTTREIMAMLNVTVDQALAIQKEIDKYWLLDYSSCTQREFELVVVRQALRLGIVQLNLQFD